MGCISDGGTTELMATSLGKLQAWHTGTCVVGLKVPKSIETAIDRGAEEITVLKTIVGNMTTWLLYLLAAKMFKLRPEVKERCQLCSQSMCLSEPLRGFCCVPASSLGVHSILPPCSLLAFLLRCSCVVIYSLFWVMSAHLILLGLLHCQGCSEAGELSALGFLMWCWFCLEQGF